jgi:hypothetical protein
MSPTPRDRRPRSPISGKRRSMSGLSQLTCIKGRA